MPKFTLPVLKSAESGNQPSVKSQMIMTQRIFSKKNYLKIKPNQVSQTPKTCDLGQHYPHNRYAALKSSAFKHTNEQVCDLVYS